MKKKVNAQNKTKVSDEKNSFGNFRILSGFEQTNKKLSPHERNFLLILPFKC